MSLQPGQVIEGKYRIVRMIGEGGMGAVFEGENIRIQRRVAIKVLHPAFTGSSDVTARFEREAQAAGKIGNDHILEVLDLGTLPDGSHFMVLEFLDGEPLSARIRRLGRMTPEDVAPIALQVAQGLGAAHAAGIIHRDLKPDNIFVLKEKAGFRDYVKIIDFGISKFQTLSGEGMKMTSTGAVMGTPYYMPPEQASGSRPADARSDIYSVGVILYECVTGRVPFDGETFNQLMFKIVLSTPPPLHEVVPDLHPAFASIIVKAMARDAEHRFQSTEELAKAITAWVERRAMVSNPPPPEQPDAVIPGVSRERLASVSSFVPSQTSSGASSGQTAAPVPEPSAQPFGASVPGRHGQTNGTFASSQAGAVPSKSTITAAVAGGVLLFGGLLIAVGLHRSGPSAAESAATPTAAAAARAATPVAPAATPPTAVPPAKLAPAITVAPVPTVAASVVAPPVAAVAATPHKSAQTKPAHEAPKPHHSTVRPSSSPSQATDFGY